MSDYATKQDVQDIVNKAVDDMSEVMQNMMQHISAEFIKVHTRIDELHQSIDKLTNTLDGFAKRVEYAELENAARDAQFAKLLDWARKVSKKTGIPIVDL